MPTDDHRGVYRHWVWACVEVEMMAPAGDSSALICFALLVYVEFSTYQ